MPRKKANPTDQPATGTDVVRVQADIARMLALISTATGESIADIISPVLRAFVEKRYAEVVNQLGEEVKKLKRP